MIQGLCVLRLIVKHIWQSSMRLLFTGSLWPRETLAHFSHSFQVQLYTASTIFFCRDVRPIVLHPVGRTYVLKSHAQLFPQNGYNSTSNENKSSFGYVPRHKGLSPSGFTSWCVAGILPFPILSSYSFLFQGSPGQYAMRKYSCWCQACSSVRFVGMEPSHSHERDHHPTGERLWFF